MDHRTIVSRLGSSDGLPREALLAATARREEMAPLFIEEIERYIAGEPDRASDGAIFFMFHLLGEWRVTAANPLLARLLRMPDGKAEYVLGDASTETSDRVMAAVYDGDPQPLYDIILDADADEFIRSKICFALAILVLEGKYKRERAAQFFRQCFTSIQPQGPHAVWDGWAFAIADLGLEELAPLVREVFERKFVPEYVCAYKDFEEELQHVLETGAPPPHAENLTPFGDTIEELSWLFATSGEKREETSPLLRKLDDLWEADNEPVTTPFRHVGRNDPCPCGSGKKYKKCCLN